MAAGVKTYNGAIGVDSTGVSVETILEKAEKAGMATGLVATCRITHATPASFAAHNENRRNYDAIANDYIDAKVDGKLAVDLLLGGGIQYFDRQDRNLVQEFKQAGYDYITSLELDSAAPDDVLLEVGIITSRLADLYGGQQATADLQPEHIPSTNIPQRRAA